MTTWHILGAGSLGGLWATRLAKAGVPVTLILRDQTRVAQYRQQGGQLTLVTTDSRTSIAIEAQSIDTANSARPEPISRLLVACKAYDAEPSVARLAPRLIPGAEVILLQNGMGSQQAVAARIPKARCIFASSTEGAFRESDWQVRFAGHGFNWLGDAGDPTAPSALLEDLHNSGIAHQWTPDILTRLWRKLALNCAINPLTVLHHCPNGGLLEHPCEVTTLCAELAGLLQRCGQPAAAHDLHSEVQRVIQATAANFSSMYQDVAHNRRTEIDYLLGYACRAALRHQCPTPHLQHLYERLCRHLDSKGLRSD